MRQDMTDGWQRWSAGDLTNRMDVAEPRLLCWDAATSPAQRRMQEYLASLEADLGPLPRGRSDLYLSMDIDVQHPVRLERDYDLDNYLAPVVGRLGATRFAFVSATKRVGGGSEVRVGLATPLVALSLEGWGHFGCVTGSVGDGALWKRRLRGALASTNPRPLPSGRVAVQLAWRYSAGRNWLNLWKPTIDSMGPVLGEPRPNQPFHPDDGRIVDLRLHRTLDDNMG